MRLGGRTQQKSTLNGSHIKERCGPCPNVVDGAIERGVQKGWGMTHAPQCAIGALVFRHATEQAGRGAAAAGRYRKVEAETRLQGGG